MKRALFVFMSLLLFALLTAALAGCGGDGSGTAEPGNGGSADDGGAGPGPEVEAFTLAELAEFDGKDGRHAYVAVDGVVYDITGSDEWPEGDHAPCDLDAVAGKDLSEVLERSPARMRALIEAMPVVGKLEE
ncbi:MAG: cytochrome b5 domain-containing protein [Actinomycetota bacterium]|nr:cytochrome b5 domain-containing protein [Actinomycetota bacterium]